MLSTNWGSTTDILTQAIHNTTARLASFRRSHSARVEPEAFVRHLVNESTVPIRLFTIMASSFLQIKCLSLLALLCLAQLGDARQAPFGTGAVADPVLGGLLARRNLILVDSPTVTLDYHNGPVLTGTGGAIPVYVLWYGGFNETDKAAIRDFLGSFQEAGGEPTDVMRWWSVTGGFKDASGAAVAGSVRLGGELDDASCSLGKSLKTADIEALVVSSLSTFPSDPQGIYFVMTAADVVTDEFCLNSCSSHFATKPGAASGGLQLPYAWVGNPKDQCPGMCAWPFAQPAYMPSSSSTSLPLPPNGDVGADAMVIQMAYMLAGTASNPFDNAYYEGDASVPLEAGTACSGFGYGAYNGYPGELQRDAITGGEYNAKGINDRKFMLPTIWDPATRDCTPLTQSP